jgi:octaprenyl-diphosphate synthase
MSSPLPQGKSATVIFDDEESVMALTQAKRPATQPERSEAPDLIDRLGDLCRGQGLDGFAERLRAMAELSSDDMRTVELTLAALPRGRDLVLRSANHLLDLGGKRLRPLCVALAARVGGSFGPKARELAVSVELVHSATLLHDDVIDVGERRRGAPTARMLYGNAASIFAGDWLLTEALRRVRQADVPGTLDRLLAVIQEMILAESVQLECRGRVNADRTAYFQIVEGKTASLFRWALDAGGRAGGLDEEHCHALASYGMHMGVAFQAVDDLLDLTGSPASTGKALFTDLCEGKITYPLILGLEREPGLRAVLEELLERGHGAREAEAKAAGPETDAEPLVRNILAVLHRTSSAEDCRLFARERAATAVRCLAPLPAGEAREALETVAAAAVERAR